MPVDLSRLLKPQSVAVLGGGWAHNVVEQCVKAGFSGELWPIHPSADSVHGFKCFRSIDDLPAAPDAAFIGINREATIDAVKQLSGLGCGGVICFASGFSEAAAEDARAVELQTALLAAAGKMPLIGPNCYGLINYMDGASLWPDQHGGKRVQTGVAILTQSSNIAINITMQHRGLPIAYVMTAGNQSQLSLGVLGESLLADERVTALGMYIESVGDVQAFEQMAGVARKLGKPVVAIKAGRSSAARDAMVSHTNSLAGGAAAADSFLKRIGVTRVESLPELVETLKLLHVFGPLPGRRVQTMSCSGGEAALVADAALRADVEFPELCEPQLQALRQALGPRVALANPLDYHTYIWNNSDAMQAAFGAMMDGEADVTALILDFPRADRCDDSTWQAAIDALDAAGQSKERRVAIIATLPENLSENIAEALLARGIVPLCGIDEALQAIANAADASHSLVLRPQPTIHIHDKSQHQFSRSRIVTEAAAKLTLASTGLPVPRSLSLESADKFDEADIDAQLNYPLVLKASGLAHKTEVRGVITDITGFAGLQTEALAMAERLEQRNLAFEGFLVEEQVGDVLAEMLVSVVRDNVHGLLLTLAAGGTQTELLKDARHLLLPFSAEDIERELQALSIAPLLDGYRGAPCVSRELLLDFIMKLQDFAIKESVTLHELEINPLLCGEHSVIIGDALLVVGEELG